MALVTSLATLSCHRGNDEAGTEPVRASTSRPSYYEDVYPIFAEHCLACHATGGVSAHVRLDDYDAASFVAVHISHAVSSREMPPWGLDSSGQCGEFVAPSNLSSSEISTVLDWIGGGLAPGDPAKRRFPAHVDPPLILGGDVLELAALDGYRPPLASGGMRCAVVDPALTRDRLLTGIGFSSANPFSVRQVALYALDSADAERRAKELEDEDALPGYACTGGPVVEGARFVVGTTFASPVMRLPARTGVRLPAGRKMIVQVDYNLNVGLDTSSALRVDAELDDAAREGAWTAIRAATLTLPPQTRDARVEVRTVLDRDLDVVAVYPSMRLLGQSMQLTVDRPAGAGRACLLNQQHWDMHMLRDVRVYEQQPHLQARSLLTLTCNYTTLSRTAPVRQGDGIDDEDCGLLLLAATAPPPAR
jgi:hypothetical protein